MRKTFFQIIVLVLIAGLVADPMTANAFGVSTALRKRPEYIQFSEQALSAPAQGAQYYTLSKNFKVLQAAGANYRRALWGLAIPGIAALIAGLYYGGWAALLAGGVAKWHVLAIGILKPGDSDPDDYGVLYRQSETLKEAYETSWDPWLRRIANGGVLHPESETIPIPVLDFYRELMKPTHTEGIRNLFRKNILTLVGPEPVVTPSPDPPPAELPPDASRARPAHQPAHKRVHKLSELTEITPDIERIYQRAELGHLEQWESILLNIQRKITRPPVIDEEDPDPFEPEGQVIMAMLELEKDVWWQHIQKSGRHQTLLTSILRRILDSFDNERSVAALRDVIDVHKKAASRYIQQKSDRSTPGGAPGILIYPLLNHVDPEGKNQGAAAWVWTLAGLFDGLVGLFTLTLLHNHPVSAIVSILVLGVLIHSVFGVVARDRQGWYVKGWKLMKLRRFTLSYLLRPVNFRELLFAISAFSSSLLALAAPTPTLFVIAAIGTPIVINLLYLARWFPSIAKDMIGAIVLFLCLNGLWGYMDPYVFPDSPRYDLLRMLPVSVFSGLISGIFIDRVQFSESGKKGYSRKRLRDLSIQVLGFVMMDSLYSAPIEGAVIYDWLLDWIPGHITQAIFDATLLSPFLIDPLAFYIGHLVFAPIDEGLSPFDPASHRHAVQKIREHMVRFYVRTLPGWFLSVLASRYLSSPVPRFTALNVGIILWSLEYARAMRKDYNPGPIRFSQWWGIRHSLQVYEKRFGQPRWVSYLQQAGQKYLQILQSFLDQPWIGKYYQGALLGLYLIAVGRQLERIGASSQVLQTWMIVSLIIGWFYIHIRHVLWPLSKQDVFQPAGVYGARFPRGLGASA